MLEKEINANFQNILSSFVRVEYMKRKEKCCNNQVDEKENSF